MKDKLIYAVSFLLVFAVITGLLFYMNTTYRNIFAFDFTPPEQAAPADSVQSAQGGLAEQKPDSTAAKAAIPDSAKQTPALAKNDSTAAAPGETPAAPGEVKPAPDAKKTADAGLSAALKEKNIAKRDSVYKSWVKSAGKLYETMDTKKAAKIILGYSDNIARDLLLIMKKKKAAEIIAEFKPDVATRIISAQQ